MNTKNNKKTFNEFLTKVFGNRTFSRKELLSFCKENNFTNLNWFLNSEEYKVGRGLYQLSETVADDFNVQKEFNHANVVNNVLTSEEVTLERNNIPDIDPLFVKHGEFDLISTILDSRVFYPMFITGLSGNGKTFAVEQACAKNKRELFRVNITIETDEDDLLGGFRLVKDETKWFDGPVIRAMKSGGVLLLDEVDLGSNKLLCLQPVLEGKGILLKKINEYVKPAPGFTIVATANTKGQGSESGKFVGTNILNEAFLERFCVTFEQKYPDERIETSILKKIFSSHDLSSDCIDDFILRLVTWAYGTRKTYDSGGTSDLISTRRLVHIANAYAILGHPDESDKRKIGNRRKQSIELCINRFDDSTKMSFIDFYETIDPYLNLDEDDNFRVLSDESQNEVKEEPKDILSILMNQS